MKSFHNGFILKDCEISIKGIQNFYPEDISADDQSCGDFQQTFNGWKQNFSRRKWLSGKCIEIKASYFSTRGQSREHFAETIISHKMIDEPNTIRRE
jgi:hypothetical protein